MAYSDTDDFSLSLDNGEKITVKIKDLTPRDVLCVANAARRAEKHPLADWLMKYHHRKVYGRG